MIIICKSKYGVTWCGLSLKRMLFYGSMSFFLNVKHEYTRSLIRIRENIYTLQEK